MYVITRLRELQNNQIVSISQTALAPLTESISSMSEVMHMHGTY